MQRNIVWNLKRAKYSWVGARCGQALAAIVSAVWLLLIGARACVWTPPLPRPTAGSMLDFSAPALGTLRDSDSVLTCNWIVSIARTRVSSATDRKVDWQQLQIGVQHTTPVCRSERKCAESYNK